MTCIETWTNFVTMLCVFLVVSHKELYVLCGVFNMFLHVLCHFMCIFIQYYVYAHTHIYICVCLTIPAFNN